MKSHTLRASNTCSQSLDRNVASLHGHLLFATIIYKVSCALIAVTDDGRHVEGSRTVQKRAYSLAPIIFERTLIAHNAAWRSWRAQVNASKRSGVLTTAPSARNRECATLAVHKRAPCVIIGLFAYASADMTCFECAARMFAGYSLANSRGTRFACCLVSRLSSISRLPVQTNVTTAVRLGRRPKAVGGAVRFVKAGALSVTHVGASKYLAC